MFGAAASPLIAQQRLRFYWTQGHWSLIKEGLNSILFFIQEVGGFVP